jgi:hypothetical protein
LIYVGIDPGLDGALAIIFPDMQVVCDTPTVNVVGKNGTKREYLTAEMAKILSSFREAEVRAVVELVHAMPGQGVRSMFSMGYGVGLWEGLLAGSGIPYERVTPQRWKKALMDGMGKEKDASRFKAQQLFPKAELHLKKHHGRAEALLLAEWLRRTSA